jgi:RNA polymerase sigma-70 factor (TIGR02957 family)
VPSPTGAFEAVRDRLFAVAYRMLGSASEAEDVLQDACRRWIAADGVRDPEAFLVRVVTRLCLNELGAARRRREVYVGPWLPEPVLTAGGATGPVETLEHRESVSLAALVLLERLTPTERAVLVLRDVVGYSYADLAGLLELSEANCRQLYSRARAHLRSERARFDAGPEAQAELTRRLLNAVTSGDVTALEALLTEDVTVWTDGGGRARAALRPVHGREAVARFLLAVTDRAAGGLDLRSAEVNGQVGLLALTDGQLTHVGLVTATPDGVDRVYVIANPDKLRYAAAQLAVTTGGAARSWRA